MASIKTTITSHQDSDDDDDFRASPSPAGKRDDGQVIEDMTSPQESSLARDPSKVDTTTTTTADEIDAHNLAILRIRGLNTTETRGALFDLAQLAEANRTLSPLPALDVAFEPFHFFFYGSLQHAAQLRRVCDLPTDPAADLTPAAIEGWRVRMWGPFPALVPAPGAEVRGLAWKCTRPEDVASLSSYESFAYRLEYTEIKMAGGETLKNGRVYVYADDPDDLEDGVFDLVAYREQHDGARRPVTVQNTLGNLKVAIAAIIATWIATYTVTWLRAQQQRPKAARMGKDPYVSGLRRTRDNFLKNSRALTKEGYTLYKDSMYWIHIGDFDHLVVSNRYLDGLRKLPDSHLDSKTVVVERNLGWYNCVCVILESTVHLDVCRTQLVQKVSFARHFHDFHFFNASETMLNILNQSTARFVVGEPLCYNDLWLRTCMEVGLSIGMMCKDLQQYPTYLRPLIYPFSAARREYRRSFGVAQELLSTEIRGRNRGDDTADILQWLIDSYKGEELSIPFLTKHALFVGIASTRSPATSLVNMLLDLLAYPEYQEPLRQEIETSLAEAADWNPAAIRKMKRLDSFIKESQRLNHHLLLAFNRKVRRPITPPDGVELPAGTLISAPSYWAARDPNTITDRDQFHPLRWFELREKAEQQGQSATQYLASSTSPDNLSWGYGRNACQGRFMAVAEMKLVLAWILHHFDISFLDGQTTRPENVVMGERVLPDPAQQIGFRRRYGAR